MEFLAISGSLRANSSNSTVLRAVASLAPPDVGVRVYEELGELLHFNPDLDVEPAPQAVARLRAHLKAADAVLICSPEYAHGVPGSLKNALDWVVGSGEFMAKPVALLNASPRSTHAQESLAETLRTMTALIVPDASIPLPLPSRKLTAEEIASDPELAMTLRGALFALARAARSYRAAAE